MATVLHAVGWPVLGFGLVLLGIHFALKNKAERVAALPTGVPIRRAPTYQQDAFGNMPPPATAWSPAVFAAIE